MHFIIRYPIYTTLCWRLNLLSMRPESWEKGFLWLQNIEFAPIWPQLIHLCKSKYDWVRTLAQRKKAHMYWRAFQTPYCREQRISACFLGSYETSKLINVAGAGNKDVVLKRRPTNQDVLMFVTLQYWSWVCGFKYHLSHVGSKVCAISLSLMGYVMDIFPLHNGVFIMKSEPHWNDIMGFTRTFGLGLYGT